MGLGYNTAGGTFSAAGIGTGAYIFHQFTADSSFSCGGISCYGKANGADIHATCGIYSDNFGVAETVLGTTGEITISFGTPNTPQWWDALFGSPVSIVNGTTYWIVREVDGAFDLYYDLIPAPSFYDLLPYSAGAMPGTSPSLTSWYTDRTFSIYATVAAGGGSLVPGTTSTGSVTTTTLTVSESGASGTGTLHYQFQRAPDVASSPGSWANIGTNGTSASFGDTGLSPNTVYWYRCVVADDNGSATSGQVSVRTGGGGSPAIGDSAAFGSRIIRGY